MIKLPFALNTLQTFTAAAEQLSFKLAAERLHLSPSAVSRQIQTLEESLQTTLFIRQARSLELTAEGKKLLTVARHSLTALAEVAAEISSRDDKNDLVISALPYFANNWLLPRLTEFTDANPDVQLTFDSDLTYKSFDEQLIDGCFRFAPEKRDDLIAMKLFRQYAVPVVKPELLQQHDWSQDLSMLEKMRWFDSAAQPELWSKWQDVHQCQHLQPLDRISFDDAETALQAARQGLGVSMAAWPLIEMDVKEGRLVCLTEPSESLCEIYYFVYSKTNSNPSLLAMVEWLKRYQQLD